MTITMKSKHSGASNSQCVGVLAYRHSSIGHPTCYKLERSSNQPSVSAVTGHAFFDGR